MAHDANLAHMGHMTVVTWSIFLAHRHPTICVPVRQEKHRVKTTGTPGEKGRKSKVQIGSLSALIS